MTESDKSEACLNAFLNGLNADLADKLYAAPDVENSFVVAVSTARKLENMRKVRAAPATPEQETLSSVFRVTQHSDSRGSHDQHERQHRNIDLRDPMNSSRSCPTFPTTTDRGTTQNQDSLVFFDL